ncbi:Zinc finger MYM-type protein 1 [Eumeta japonica]|uniref:Zinc finger MYM-type protein 1 n=1 Tax=Eumeta variegata TaxID=151549 RepID=A0A4C1VLS1_EUMVA|nr:Zinc finger MYM-type protein 1 [Eumeta japonica]
MRMRLPFVCAPCRLSRIGKCVDHRLICSGGLTYKHYKHVLGAPVLQGPPSSAGVSFYTYILSRFIHNMSEITRREQSGSDPSYTPAGPCPLRAPPARRVAPRDRWRTKTQTGRGEEEKNRCTPKNDIVFPTNQLESGKDNNVCQESQSLSSVRTQIDKNGTTGTSDDHFDDDEINSEIKTPVPVPDKSEPVIVAIPEVSKIELVNSNKKTDAGLWTEFSEEDICYWIDHGPENCQLHQGPFHESRRTYASGKSVRFCTPRLFFGKKANGETYKREWLLYSKTKGSLYCFVCKLFGNKSIATAPSQFAADGFSDWRNVIAIEHHENSSAHKDFMLTYLSQRQGLGITKNLEAQVKEERKYWQNVLQRVIAVIQTLAERVLAFRGHDESFGSIHNGNFLGLLKLVAQFDPFLASHIARYGNKGKGNPSYLSKTVCDELIDLMSDKIHIVIVEEIQSAGYFSLSVNSTPDLSHTDQLSSPLKSYIWGCVF